MDIKDVLFFRVPFREVRSNNIGTRVFQFDNFVLKWVSQSEGDFKDVVRVMGFVESRGFPIAKLVYSDYVKGKGIYVFERVRGRDFDFEDDYVKLGRFVSSFYEITDGMVIGKKRPILDLRLTDGLIKEVYEFLKGCLCFKEERVIFGDLHMGNVMVKEDGGFCFVDFDNVYMGELEEDLGKMLLGFSGWKLGKKELKKFSQVLKGLGLEYSVEKIVLYALYELFWVFGNKRRFDSAGRGLGVWFIDWFYRHKDVIVRALESFVNE